MRSCRAVLSSSLAVICRILFSLRRWAFKKRSSCSCRRPADLRLWLGWPESRQPALSRIRSRCERRGSVSDARLMASVL
ncbi:hypothetical protein BJX61DRAFT_498227 [Aspergillus egyptiacus]|nr:hypothetical protein BJX61DRAFT_498227 [Aspergillus egyptiacus]